ncbi:MULTISPECIES: prephenate dehydrogenase [Flavobacteriaceae]|uniref:Prephenate dehydrogenase n=2 Tax=Flavobacteriaceae TaxID=49546 RepID=A0A4Y8ASX1_9FLAO|nr:MULTISPECIES: prephenate dehydrogenase [Flavobacteriaceae]TEW74974.1 prephenate dehydrogenase [Gramella jeungdoensis]GGK42636.1 prephenate dehydrogenase [Lutibacter litoralis]
MKKLVVIGLGLIGGSLALDLKKRGNYKVYGVDQNPNHIKKALKLGVIDEEISFSEIVDAAVIIIAVPVNIIPNLTTQVLDIISENTLVFDVGSVKNEICKAVENHKKRKNFVAAHPLAGTEFSGPEAAILNLFEHKVNIICEADKTDWKILDEAISLFKQLNMRIKMMQPVEHDRHIAYVSHLSHISSFMLGKTVLQIEKNEQAIFDMASTGFASTVRLAKSNADTWAPIFLENKDNIITSLNEYIKNLNEFKDLIENTDDSGLRESMKNTNYIKSILNGIKEND